jgi:hypothetical protein
MEVSYSAARGRSVADRTELRAGLEAARAAFHGLVQSVPGDQWREKSGGSAWTKGEVLVHLAWALEQLPEEVAKARQGKGMFNMPKWFADPASYWMIRWQARKSDADSVRRRYDAAIDAAIAAMDLVPDTDWTMGAPFYGHGFHTVTELFRVPLQHLVEHTEFWDHPGLARHSRNVSDLTGRVRSE